MRLYHYTFSVNIPLIIKDGLKSSVAIVNGDAQWGDGQYFTDLTPNEATSLTRFEHSFAIFNMPWKWGGRGNLKSVGWIEFELELPPVVRVAPLFGTHFSQRGIYLLPNSNYLPIANVMTNQGLLIFMPSPSGFR